MFQADSGAWVGPYDAAEGERWFLIRERTEAGPPPPYEELLGQLRFDWITEQEDALLQERLAELRERYRVRFVDERSERGEGSER